MPSDHVPRITIALETSKGNLSLALALGLILIVLSAAVSAASWASAARWPMADGWPRMAPRL
jgi:hypothetical protein